MSTQFGRVDAQNNVFVKESADSPERKVGQYPGVTEAEALAYFVRKFEDLAAQVRILEQRVANKIDSQGMQNIASKLTKDLQEPSAVGDIADLRRRVSNLDSKISVLASEKSEASKEIIAATILKRTKIAERAEQISNQEVTKIQWKNSGAEMTKLFEEWQLEQKSGVKISKREADKIWKRFSSARTRFESEKRTYFASLDASNKITKAKKISIIDRAEMLATKGSDDVTSYRKLLDEWKSSGRTPGKSDDALWLRFKAAGDAIYAKKTETVVIESAAQVDNLAAKTALLAEAESIEPIKDLAQAKKSLASVQQRWEKAGKVPRDSQRVMDDRLKKIETKVKQAEEELWRKSDPAAIARTDSVTIQLEDSINKLEKALEKATASQDSKAIQTATEALDARKSWLEVVKASMA